MKSPLVVWCCLLTLVAANCANPDFLAFDSGNALLPDPSEDGPFLDKEEIQRLLEDEFRAEDCLNYADKRLGIERRLRFADTASYGWMEYEDADGRYEDVNLRYERVLRGLPGADRGYVYVMTSKSFPGVVKIGKTHRRPEERAAEVSRLERAEVPFKVELEQLTSNCYLLERLVHERLASHRVLPTKEFFSVSNDEAVRCIREIAAGIEDEP